MRVNPKPGEPGEEEMFERAILSLALAVYPLYRTIPELIRDMGRPALVRRAVANLVGCGLIVLHGNTLLPTPAAFHCHRLATL